MQKRFRVRSVFNREQGMHLVFLLTACVSIAAVVLLGLVIGINGLSALVAKRLTRGKEGT